MSDFKYLQVTSLGFRSLIKGVHAVTGLTGVSQRQNLVRKEGIVISFVVSSGQARIFMNLGKARVDSENLG